MKNNHKGVKQGSDIGIFDELNYNGKYLLIIMTIFIINNFKALLKKWEANDLI